MGTGRIIMILTPLYMFEIFHNKKLKNILKKYVINSG